EDGLIAYWPFDGDLQDAIGDSHGEGMGSDDIAYGSGKFGQGIDLDGIDQFIQTPVENEEMFDFQDGTGFSVSAWYRVDGWNMGWQALIAKGEGNRWRVHRAREQNNMTGNGGSGDVGPDTNPDINDGEIHHIVLVSDPDAGEVCIFSDGELVATGNAPAIQSNDNPMMIGENPDARNRTWNGLIDDVGIWDRPITAEEVALIYKDGGGTALVSSGAAGAGGRPPPD
ncbi:MAG: LamG domain-containing protein, partial [Planctomycetaceae bacterium]|nr:LamG domain-containing protein [Planctomycetaceae bacterium]